MYAAWLSLLLQPCVTGRAFVFLERLTGIFLLLSIVHAT